MRRALLSAVVTAGFVLLPGVARAEQLGVTITSPAPGAIVSGVVPIAAIATGPVTAVAFEATTDAGATWSLIDTDTDPADGWGAAWDSAGYSGSAVLRASVTDGVITASATVEVTVRNPAVLLVTLGRPAFSPNGDGRADRARIVVWLPDPGTLDVRIQRASGTVVQDLAEAEPVEAGTTALAWDGTDGAGRSVADGGYRIVAEATDPSGTVETAEAAIVVDTHAPGFRWSRISPEPYRGVGDVRFAFHSADRSAALRVSALVTDANGHRVDRIGAAEVSSGTAALSWNGNDAQGVRAEPGLYGVAITVRDDAGNRRTSEVRLFRNHRPVTTSVIRRVEGAGPLLALTFDDCTSAPAWTRILDVLEAKHVAASFFCSGPWVAANPSLARRTAEAGSTIGSHGWDHANFTTLTVDQARARLREDDETWWQLARRTTVPYFRPPYGEYDARTLRAAGAEGYRYTVLWDVDPWDWSQPGVSEIVHRVLSHARAGSIVVLHVQRETAAALPALIDGLRREGLEPVTLDELIRTGRP